jgi:hypothetical protein
MIRARPRGAAATMIIFGSTVVLLMCTIFAYVYGQAYAEKDAMRQRADAVVLAAAEAFRKYGPAEANGDICDAVRPILLPGEACPELVHVDAPNEGYRIVWPPGGGVVRSTIDVPLGMFDTRQVEITASAESFAAESVIEEVEERRAKLVLVLDVSGSMNQTLGGQACNAQKAAVRGLMDRAYRVDYGLVLFADGVRSVIPVAPGNEAAIRSRVNDFGCPGRATNYAAGLGRALDLFRAVPDTGRFTLFATDGEYNQGGDGMPQARALWNNEATIFTLNIGASGGFRQNLWNMSGNRDHQGDRNFAYEAGNTAELLAQFDEIIAAIVCRAELPADLVVRGGLDNPRGFIVARRDRRNQAETRLTFVPRVELEQNPRRYRDTNAYTLFVENGRRLAKLNQRACLPILDGTADIVMRATRPALVSR